jgi:acetoacetate decarboxylase
MQAKLERTSEMLYSLDKEQVNKLTYTYSLADFQNAEMLVAIFKTDPDIVREILPKPLKTSSDAYGMAFVARYPETNFGCVYNEGALFLNCEFKGERGAYCLSMPVDDDIAMAGGREYYGYPKKMAENISLERNGDYVVGSVIRKGTEIIRIECQLDQDAPDDVFENLAYPTEDWDGIKCQKFISFPFKYFPSPSGNSFDYFPRLIREPVLFRPLGKLRAGTGQICLGCTAYEPLGVIPVNSISNIAYGVFHNTMLPGRVVGRVWNPLRFSKHAFFKVDSVPTIIDHFDADQIEQSKTIMQKAKRY